MKNKAAIKIILFLTILFTAQFSYQLHRYATAAAAEKESRKHSELHLPLNSNQESVAVSQISLSVLTRMHYLKKEITEELSVKFFHEYLKKLDPMHMFFTKEIIDDWESLAPNLISHLVNGKPYFAYVVYNHYLGQLAKYRSYVQTFSITDDELKGNEVFEYERSESDWPENDEEMREIWRKKMLNDVILLKIYDRIEQEKTAENKDSSAEKWKKLPPLEQVKKRILQFVTNEEDATSITVIELYLNSLAALYDPHTEYMAPATEEDFNINMSLSLFGIGAVLSSADDGSTRIVKLIPGGPAMKNGQLHAEDRIIAVAQGNKEPVDIIDMPLKKVVSLIRGPAGSEVVLTVLDSKSGAAGQPKTVRLIREEIELKESEAKAEVKTVRGNDGRDRRIAIITLPSFYFDFQGAAAGKKDFKSSTKDVQALIRKIRKDGEIDALVMDLRYNGGGSLSESVKLTGLFIPQGPVVQVVDTDGGTDVEYDNDGGYVEYNGPLLVLTNRFSASASEIFAGAIQDYGRGIVAGDTRTHGKGTVQTIVDIDEYFRYLGLPFKGGSLKLTKSKFYRINGHSTQLRGVEPDLVIPAYTDAMESGEDSLDNPMQWDEITPAIKSEKQDLSSAISVLSEKSEKRRADNPEFQTLLKDIERYRKHRNRKMVSLNFEVRWKEYQDEKRILEEQKALADPDSEQENKKKKDIFLEEIINVASDYAELLQSEK